MKYWTTENEVPPVVKYWTTELKVPPVVEPPTDTTAATPSLTTSGELMQVPDIISGQLQMPQVTSRQGSSQMRLSSERPEPDNHIVSQMPDSMRNPSQMENAKPDQPISLNLANYHIEIGFRRRHGDGSGVAGGADSQIAIFDDESLVKAIVTYFVTCQPVLDFSDQIVRQDYSSVFLQVSYGPCQCSRLQIKLIDEQ